MIVVGLKDLAILSGLLLTKSIVLLLVRRFGNELYCSPQCAISLMEKNDHAALQRHPYWKDLKPDGSCGSASMDKYVSNQLTQTERKYMDAFVKFWLVTGICFLVYEFIQGLRKVTLSRNLSLSSALSSSVVSSVFGVFSATIFLMHTHFNVDITHLGGGIVHHAMGADPRFVGINDKNASVSEGYLVFGALNRFFYMWVLWALVARDERLKKCFSPLVLIGLLQIQTWVAVKQVGKNHVVYHEMSKHGSTNAMNNAWPYTMEWRAYKHCITHHDNGLSFSGDFFLDPFWDLFLYAFSWVHNDLLKIPLGSTAHFVFSGLGDVVMGVMTTTLLYCFLHIGSWFVTTDDKVKKED
jgi:hypothetical protein